MFVGPEEEPGELAFVTWYVVKLADVAHRSDIGGVRVGVRRAELRSNDRIAEYRRSNAPARDVAIQR